MAIFEIASDAIRRIEETTFSAAGIRERGDLQRLLRKYIDTISPDTLVVAEEFGDWEDSKRRIDLLGVDKDANIVVIELKRTEDGGHMELQSIRYAAMVSMMTFDKVVKVYTDYLQKLGSNFVATTSLLEFLGWDEPDEDRFAQDVRIVLASAEFSKELTTAVMWLNKRELDIRCVRIKPYADNGRVLIDVQQVIPLPEAAEYQVQIRDKEQKGRQDRAEQSDVNRKFWQGLLARASGKVSLSLSPSRGPRRNSSDIGGVTFGYEITRDESGVSLYIDRGSEEVNKRIFDNLHNHRAEIEQVFGEELSWRRLDHRRACRIVFTTDLPGLRSDESQWPKIQDAVIDAMVRLERAFKPHLAKLRIDI